MNIQELTYLLQHPNQLKEEQMKMLENLLLQFPYFQSARSITLKGLKAKKSFRYNQALKTTAAYTADRSVLFDFITSQKFPDTAFSNHIITKNSKEDINVVDAQEIKTTIKSLQDNIIVTTKDGVIFDPSSLTSKEETDFRHTTIAETIIKNSEEKKDTHLSSDTHKVILNPDEPLDFNKNEAYSFSEWLKLTTLKPIDTNTSVKKTSQKLQEEQSKQQETASQTNKFDIIDKFIASNPKIQPAIKTGTSPNLAEKNLIPDDQLMTETLAKVYLAQKNYKKAIQAKIPKKVVSLQTKFGQ